MINYHHESIDGSAKSMRINIANPPMDPYLKITTTQFLALIFLARNF